LRGYGTGGESCRLSFDGGAGESLDLEAVAQSYASQIAGSS
jgi:hypothetical protein